MSKEDTKISVSQTFKIEKRNDDGELYEVVEIEADGQGVTHAKVSMRREGLAPAESYARAVPVEQSTEE